jgi:RNA polymerase sigma factor (sigma-70 family)
MRSPTALSQSRSIVMTDESLSHYLSVISLEPLLTAEEEIELGKLIQAGRGDTRRAFDRMYRANLRFVVTVAARYARRTGTLTLAELISEGNLGLHTAVGKFDPDRNVKFATHAAWWISAAIRLALADTSRTHGISRHRYVAVNKLRRTEEQLAQTLQRWPTSQELQAKLGWSNEKFRQAQDDNLTRPLELDSLAFPEDDEDETELHETLPCRLPPVLDQIISRLEIEWLYGQVYQLSPIQRELIVRHHGLAGYEAETFAGLSTKLKISASRLRRDHQRAMNALTAAASTHQEAPSADANAA